MNRKIKAVYFHVAPGIGGLVKTSYNDTMGSMELIDQGVICTTNIASVLVPFSNIVGVWVVKETESEPSKDSQKVSRKN